jgi:hypothetical protein
VAGDMALAVTTSTWLSQHGIPAHVSDLLTLGGLEGLTGLAPGVSAHGLEVWVDDPAQAAEARRLLAEHEEELAHRTAREERQGPVEVVCEECGRSSIFPGSQYGTIQDCPHCGAYLDVEEWDGEAGDE